MTPGTLFFDRHFQFHDGEEGPKILVALGTGHGVTIVVKTTSQGRRYRNDYGCQASGPPGAIPLVQFWCQGRPMGRPPASIWIPAIWRWARPSSKGKVAMRRLCHEVFDHQS